MTFLSPLSRSTLSVERNRTSLGRLSCGHHQQVRTIVLRLVRFGLLTSKVILYIKANECDFEIPFFKYKHKPVRARPSPELFFHSLKASISSLELHLHSFFSRRERSEEKVWGRRDDKQSAEWVRWVRAAMGKMWKSNLQIASVWKTHTHSCENFPFFRHK